METIVRKCLITGKNGYLFIPNYHIETYLTLPSDTWEGLRENSVTLNSGSVVTEALVESSYKRMYLYMQRTLSKTAASDT